MPTLNESKLEKGVIYDVESSELLPIHPISYHFKQGCNRMVIPDGTTFMKVYSEKGLYAMHIHDDRHKVIKCKDESMNDVWAVYNEWNVISAYDENQDTVRFLTEKAAELNDYHFSIRLDTHCKKGARHFYGGSSILSYHESDNIRNNRLDKLPKYTTDTDEWVFGVEVEKIDSSLQEKGIAFEMLQHTGWVKEYDSSLSGGGYELISPILPLFKTSVVTESCEKVKEYLEANIDGSCGGHFNISRKGVEPEKLALQLKNIMPLLYAIYPKRTTNSYCKARVFQKYIEDNEKYSALYIKSKCVELRLFGGIKSMETLVWRVELMQILINDIDNNLNQVIMKVASSESKLYKHLAKHYTNDEIKTKVQLFYKFAERYQHGKISPSVKKRIYTQFADENMFNDNVLDLVYRNAL